MGLRTWVWHHTRPPWDRRHDEQGRCNVCGEDTAFIYNSWSVTGTLARDLAGTGLTGSYRRRESMWCGRCGANTRERGLWAVLLEHYSAKATSAKELVLEEPFRSLRIAEINRLNAGHRYLRSHPRLVYAEYPEEDLQNLSYGDATFDLVITSDTLEHVPDYQLALRETRRVLDQGGRHVFTVPLRPDLPSTRPRNGLPPVYHGEAPGPLRLLKPPSDDMRALHDLALDVVDEVVAAGFRVELHSTGVESVICAIAA